MKSSKRRRGEEGQQLSAHEVIEIAEVAHLGMRVMHDDALLLPLHPSTYPSP